MPGPLPGPSYDLTRSDLTRSHASRLTLERLAEYYRGEQPLHFLLPESRQRSIVVNIPRLVVDSIEDRLDVDGFRMGGRPTADDDLWRIWQANNLDLWSQQAHLDALLYGRSFVCVWENEDNPTTPRITVESPRQMTVEYAPGTTTVVRAVKRWVEGDSTYVTVYGPEQISRFIGPAKRPTIGAFRERSEPVPNVYGVVPVVPLVNRPRTELPFGESEMTDVIPIADAINELCDTMLVTARYYATPRRWATGVDIGSSDAEIERSREKIRQVWSQAERDRVWTSDSANTSFGQFPEADLSNFIGAIDMYTARAAALSGLPPHYFGQAGENPASADALRSSESSLVKRALRKQKVFGEAWEAVMRLALRITNQGQVPAEALSMETIWASPETPTVAQKADAAVKLVQAGVITAEQALEDLGYTPEQRARMAAERDRAALGPVKVQLDEAARLQRDEGLSQPESYLAVGLLEAGRAITQRTT